MKAKNLLKKAFLLLALVGGASSAWASTVENLATISADHSVVFEDIMNGAALSKGTLYDSNYLLSVDGNNYANDKGTNSTIKKLNCCRVKSNSQGRLAFKVSGACTLTIYAETRTDRKPFLNTDGSDTQSITGTFDGNGKATYTIPAADTYYIVGSSDFFLAGLEFTFPSGPTITTQPASAVYAVGDTPSALTVEATASAGDLSYQWYKNTDQDKTAKEADKIAGATSATLAYANISTAVEGTTYYYVVVTDGNGSTTSDLATITVAEQEPYSTPTITEKNGTVQITSSNDITVSQIKYSLDGGESWNDYSIPFNLATATTVKAKVVQGEDPRYTDSEVASKECNAIPTAVAGSLSITLYNDDSNWTKTASSSKTDTWTGRASTYLEGYIIALDNEGQTDSNIKELSSGNAINSKSTIKGSNGRRIKFTIPEGIKVNRITIYSYTNGDNGSKYASTWSFNGETADMIGLSLRDIDENDGKSECSASNPDVRVFSFATPLEDYFYLNNSGYQQCFYMVLDYIIPSSVSKTITSAGWASFSSSYPLDLSTISGGTAYYASASDGSSVTLTETTAKVPANTGLMIKGEPNAEFTIATTSDETTAIDGNLLKGKTTTGTVTASPASGAGTYHYVFGYVTETPTTYGFYNLTSATSVDAGKAYLEITSGAQGARSLRISLGGITDIEQIDNGNIEGSLPVKRIVNGKLVIEKKGHMFNANGQLIK